MTTQAPARLKKATKQQKIVADFFAGIGLVSLGLENAGWQTVYALDYEKEKEAAYTNHFGSGHYHTLDIATASGANVPDVLLAHASFPCTDLSVAGGRKGINQGESSAFWHFVRILSEMKDIHGYGRPPFVLLENVEGLLTSNNGQDLRSALKALNDLGYRVDLMRIDASHFVPQSRVRIFIMGIHESVAENFDDNSLLQEHSLRNSNARSKKIIDYVSENSDLNWYFHPLPNLPERRISLVQIIDPKAEWWPKEKKDYLYNQMHSYHRELIDKELNSQEYRYYPAFRRMRERDGKPQSTAELRTDGIAGCLRTPKGGSARQIIVRVGRGDFDARLINGIEAARLMGADHFKLNDELSLNQILFGFGDAVCVPAIEWIGRHYLDPLHEAISL